MLFEENNMLDEENKRVLQLYHKEKHSSGSGGKNSGCTSAKVRYTTQQNLLI